MNEAQKTQFIRLIDVFVLAPFMIWFAIKARGIPDWAKLLMIIFGVLTMAYNAKNYMINAGITGKNIFYGLIVSPIPPVP